MDEAGVRSGISRTELLLLERTLLATFLPHSSGADKLPTYQLLISMVDPLPL